MAEEADSQITGAKGEVGEKLREIACKVSERVETCIGELGGVSEVEENMSEKVEEMREGEQSDTRHLRPA